MSNPVFIKFFKFVSVGAFGFGLDVLVTWLLKEKAKINKYVANSAGFLSGVTFNYIGNRIYTFQSDDPNVVLQYLKFAIIGIVGLGIVNGLIWLLHGKLEIRFFVAKVLAMFVFMFWNFGMNYMWTFAQ